MFVIYFQTLASSIWQSNYIYYNQYMPLKCYQTISCSVVEKVLFYTNAQPIDQLLPAGFDDDKDITTSQIDFR